MIPEHYSRDVVQRCRKLIDTLMPRVEGLPGDGRYGGPLTTTFLLAMATPMLLLPLERIYKPAKQADSRVGDDGPLGPTLAQGVADVLGEKKLFGESPFGESGDWRCVIVTRPFNIANPWPPDLLKELSGDAAAARAKSEETHRILAIMRNALAHGGIAYLDKNGQQSERDAAMLAFVSTVSVRAPITKLNVLRVSEGDFLQFLRSWADWFDKTPLRKALNEQSAAA